MAERITGHTELIGLLAYPIRHSSSPAIHNEAFAYLGLDYAYLAFEVDNETLEDAIKGIRALKMAGANLSMPNKIFRSPGTCRAALRSSQYHCKRKWGSDWTHY